MNDIVKTDETLLNSLKEREKELNCLYKVDEILSNHQLSLPELFEAIVAIIPSGWRFPDLCRAKITFKNSSYQPPDFIASPISEKCSIKSDGKIAGSIEVIYIKKVPEAAEGFILEKERQLIQTIADRIGQIVFYRDMKLVLNEWETSRKQGEPSSNQEWKVILDFLRDTDQDMLLNICRKMINHLLINGVNEASGIMNSTERENDNFPSSVKPFGSVDDIREKTFAIAGKHLGGNEITTHVKRWIQEEQVYSLAKAVGSISPSIPNIVEELTSYHNSAKNDEALYSPRARWLSVALISRFLSDRPEFVNTAKQYINFRDFVDIANRIIFPTGSRGNLGGKSSGLFLATKILRKEGENNPLLNVVDTPKTWYITADAFTAFLQYNNLEELNEQKYRELSEIRIDYPNIIQLLKNSRIPPEIVKSFSVALDDLWDGPLIVRSSSLLEDQVGAVFSGKYKSLFLANQGTKQERLEALLDAIIEVYSSMFSPDSIQYRAERGLLDFNEEMGIMIQEVVGRKVGPYFFPLLSGVAFSNNEYCWSPRIKREDGLVRLVPGLGTRAVDRLSDDFPVLLSPQHPEIPVNSVPDEIKRYSPKKIDVINLEQRTFQTVDLAALYRDYGDEIDELHKIVSIIEFDHLIKPNKFEIDFEKSDLVVTFDGIIAKTKYIKQINAILQVLRDKMGHPVDIEFSCDGQHLYLLQCRPQSFMAASSPAPIPKDLPEKDILFSANRHISNGLIQNIAYVVYVDAEEYHRLADIDDLYNIGKVVGLLNTVLPKRQFILAGPGRWGSRGDIKLGVRVGYADICNTAALIEIARGKKGYMSDLSFGTHFFQDLVEANIRYLPLYPDEPGLIFNSRFLLGSPNILREIFPDYARYEDVIRVINVRDVADGRTLTISMNAELGEAIGYLSRHKADLSSADRPNEYNEHQTDSKAWRWRHYMAERVAASLDARRFGVNSVYLFGSTNDGTAGFGSDIDLIVHFEGSAQQKLELVRWLEGWSLCLDEMNFLKTGYRMNGLLDVHIITNDDINRKTCFAIKISLATDPAYRLKLKDEN